MILLDYIANKGLTHPARGELEPAAVATARRRGRAGRCRRRALGRAGSASASSTTTSPSSSPGFPSIDLIDFTYEYADTSEDTVDKLDPEALDAVGEATAELLIELSAPE